MATPDLIDRLNTATLEANRAAERLEAAYAKVETALLQANEILPELRGTLKDVRAERAAIKKDIRGGIREELNGAVQRSMEELSELTARSMKACDEAIHRRFDTIQDLMLGNGRKRERMEDMITTHLARNGADDQT